MLRPFVRATQVAPGARMPKLASIALLLAAGAACTGGEPSAPQPSPDAASGPRDTLVVAVQADLGNLNPVVYESAADGHMAYRTVHVFPQVGQQISKAIDTIASGQMTAKEALAQAQANAVADLRRAGVKL